MESINEEAVASAKRPKFLTILCILSFVGIAFSIISGIMGYFSYAAMASVNNVFGAAANSAAGAAGSDNKAMGDALSALSGAVNLDYHKLALVSLIQALLNIPILVGVLMMFFQKKIGFYVYAVFEIFQPILPLVMGLGLMGGFMAIVGLVFAIVFVVLYGLNLKHMKGINLSDTKGKPGASVSKQNQTGGASMVKKGVFYETKINNVTCTQVGAAYEISLVISAKKFFTDSATGKEKEALINDEIQIGMVKGGKEIYLKSYKFTKTNTLLNLSIDQKPDKIGIDPYNKLAERV